MSIFTENNGDIILKLKEFLGDNPNSQFCFYFWVVCERKAQKNQ